MIIYYADIPAILRKAIYYYAIAGLRLSFHYFHEYRHTLLFHAYAGMPPLLLPPFFDLPRHATPMQLGHYHVHCRLLIMFTPHMRILRY